MDPKPYDQHMQELADKWLKGTITPDEEKKFAQWYNQFDDQEPLLLSTSFAKDEAALKERIRRALDSRINTQHVPRLQPVKWMAAAAVIGFLLISGIYFWRIHKGAKTLPASSDMMADLPPGSDKATLRLSDGRTMVLDRQANGALAEEGGANIEKVDSGMLTYHTATTAVPHNNHNGQEVAMAYNTLSTPRGGQFRLVLPDGTKVWLNAASSIRYPTVFSGKDRLVTITGEAYFEVAANAAKPFKVAITTPHMAAGQDPVIEVLGTSFNINAYADEPEVQTTLLHGAVRVVHMGAGTLLKPGQQAVISNKENAPSVSIRTADGEEVTAWKNGYFQFSGSDLPTVMRQLGRWYDVDIVYTGALPARKFEGEIQRNLNLKDVLDELQKNDVHFRVDGRKIIVTP